MDGFLLIDKEQDWTSFDVVAKLRNVLHEKHIGHAGTLDPGATGLLIVMLGKGCKQSDYIMHRDKEYIASLRLGISTDTQDIWGNVLHESDASAVTEKTVKEAIMRFTGDIQQIPPMYSAIKKNGKKLYEIARKGGTVEREPRNIRVESIDILGRDGDDWVLKVRCSSGTYIRTLCNDIGDFIGCGGCMSALRRTRIGGACVEQAHKVSEIKDEGFLLSLDTSFID